MNRCRHLACSALYFLSAGVLQCFASVNVVENVSPGATSWPGDSVINTMANPSATATVPESFNGGDGNTNLSQTFTVTAGGVLQAIDIYAGTGLGTGVGTNLILNLYDLGVQTAPNPSPYTSDIDGANLLGSGAGLSVSYTPQNAGVLEFDFSGADQVTLVSGHMYAFELAGAFGTTPIFWSRSVGDTYSGGAAYRNQSWINGNNARDFALAVYFTNSDTSASSETGQVTVVWGDVHQKIDGFGAGAVFMSPASLDPISTTNMNTLFGMNGTHELGLSLLRVRIDSTGDWTDALLDAQKAVALGAGVLATPWTPPAGMKSTTNIIGGYLLPSQYTNYALFLNAFAGYMASNGAPLKAISIQNEPDFVPSTYEGCDWTAAQLQSFCHDVGGLITNAPLMMPESASYNLSVSDPTLEDPVAASNVTYIGEHLYGGSIVDYPLAHNEGKDTWMTEYLVNDQTIGSAVATAKQIHDCLTVANFSGYIWWHCLEDTNGLLDAAGDVQPRGFAMAQWSRFVRPGYYRIDTTPNGNSAFVTAFNNTNSGQFAIVAVNTNAITSIVQTFNLEEFPTVGFVTPWITSATLSFSNQTPVAVSDSSFTYTLPPLSVVTFAGQASAAPAHIIITEVFHDPTRSAFVLTWNATEGAKYSVFKTNVLNASAANWPAIVTGYPANGAAAGPLSYTDTAATTTPAFYRVSSP